MSMNELRRAQRLRKTPRLLIFVGCTLAIGLAARADALPFYKAGCAPTAPAAASSVTSSTPAPLDSRSTQSATSVSGVFDSDGVPGMAIIVR